MIALHFLFEDATYDIRLLTDMEERKQFVKEFDASPKWATNKQYDIYADSSFAGGIVVNKKPGIVKYKKYKLEPEVSIAFIKVKNEYRGQGLGRQLLQVPMTKYNSIGLTTHPKVSSSEAIALYKSLGFEPAFEMKGTTFWSWNR